MTLEPWQHQVKNKIKDGDIFVNEQDYNFALNLYKEAFSLIPEPKDFLKKARKLLLQLVIYIYYKVN